MIQGSFLALVLLNSLVHGANADIALDPAAILAQYQARDEGDHVRRMVTITTRDKSGNERVRQALNCRKNFGADRRSVFFFLSPGTKRGIGFLTFDYRDPAKADDQWLYLPSVRKTRRVYSGHRNDFFVGTDFTYEEMKKETKISIEDFKLTPLGIDTIDGRTCFKVEATPISEKVAKELNYARALYWIEMANLMPRRTEYRDDADRLMRTVVTEEIEQIDGIWTVLRIVAQNELTGHFTELRFSQISYEAPIDDRMFTEQALLLGPRWH